MKRSERAFVAVVVLNLVLALAWAFHEIDREWAVEERRPLNLYQIATPYEFDGPKASNPRAFMFIAHDSDSWSVSLLAVEDNPPPLPPENRWGGSGDFDRAYIGFRHGGGVLVDRETGEIRHCATMTAVDDGPRCAP